MVVKLWVSNFDIYKSFDSLLSTNRRGQWGRDNNLIDFHVLFIVIKHYTILMLLRNFRGWQFMVLFSSSLMPNLTISSQSKQWYNLNPFVEFLFGPSSSVTILKNTTINRRQILQCLHSITVCVTICKWSGIYTKQIRTYRLFVKKVTI